MFFVRPDFFGAHYFCSSATLKHIYLLSNTMTDLKEIYDPLYKHVSKLSSDLNSDGFAADYEWRYSFENGCPMPIVSVGNYGNLSFDWNKTVYRFILTRKKALGCRFSELAAKYSLHVYGHDFSEEALCEPGDDGSDVAFAVSASKEVFFEVELTLDEWVDSLTYRKILADIRSAMNNENR